ncbi:integrase [Ensifer adhaerens]|uniref:Integrase n=1 Tax=Ensifer adhaerens TaxID=106592 RepID=A0ACC5STC4_ENSAD|nr:tyrosine-type recombinase/integrase [Ensifer adhaerens]MBP1871954.1 integrase [Ensifer adhaerens]
MNELVKGSAFQARIELVVFADGERCPMLLDGKGVPYFDPAVWALTRYRQKSASTVEQALRGAMLIHLFCWLYEIDLLERVRTGSFFSVGELEALATLACLPFNDIRKTVKKKTKTRAAVRGRARNASALLRRLPRAKRLKTVAAETTSVRLHYVCSYLRWLGERQKARFQDEWSGDAFSRSHVYEERLAGILKQVKERGPSASSKGRSSFIPGARDRLLAVADPSSPENPWTSPFVKLRNWTIVQWLIGTGMRKGELLGLLVADFNRVKRYCEIRRRQDNKRDPRRRQPAAKTFERLAPLVESLTKLGEEYLAARSKIEAARKHSFLFVSQSGKPLSLSAVTRLFATLRENFPDLGDATPHTCRHQWNEDFSDYADTIGMKSEDELRERIWLMGWSAKSNMPARYVKRRTKAKADEHSREMQTSLMKRRSERDPRS